MSKHPYPKHVVEAVSDVLSQEFHNAYEIGSFEDLTVYDQEAYKDKAGYLLQALWDASRVEHPGQVESIPGDTILTTPDNRAISAQTMQWVVRPADYPAHVIYWGDHDDR